MRERERKRLINRDALREVIDGNRLCQHAARELKLYFRNGGEDEASKWMSEQVMEAVALFSTHGNSGMSAPVEIELVRKLCNFDILTPLTFESKEWMKVGRDGLKQNTRRSSIFRESDGRIYERDAFRCRPVRIWRFDATEWEEREDDVCWSGRIYEVGKDGKYTGRWFRRCYIRDVPPYTPKEVLTIPVDEVEVEPDGWIFACTYWTHNMQKLAEMYAIDWKVNGKIKGVRVTDATAIMFEED